MSTATTSSPVPVSSGGAPPVRSPQFQFQPAPVLPYFQYFSFAEWFAFKKELELVKLRFPTFSMESIRPLIDEGILLTVEALASEVPKEDEQLVAFLDKTLMPTTAVEKQMLLESAAFAPVPQRALREQFPRHMGLFKKLLVELQIPQSKRARFFLRSLVACPHLHARLTLEFEQLDDATIDDLFKKGLTICELLDGPASDQRLPLSPRPTVCTTLAAVLPNPPATVPAARPSPQQLPPEDHAKCLRDRTCFLCKQPGHHRKDCPMGDLGKRISRPVDRYDPSPAPKPLVASAAELLPGEEGSESFEPDPRPHFNCKIAGEEVRVIADTGANCSTTNVATLARLHAHICQNDYKPSVVTFADGREAAACVWSCIDMPLPPTGPGESVSVRRVRVYAFPDAPPDITLGMDVLSDYIIDPQLKQPLLPRPPPG